MIAINLALVFIIELMTLAGIAALGFVIPAPFWMQVIISIVLVALFILFWGRFMAPRAPKRVSFRMYYIIKYVLYVITAFTIAHFYGWPNGTSFFVIALINDIILFKYNKNEFALRQHSSK